MSAQLQRKVSARHMNAPNPEHSRTEVMSNWFHTIQSNLANK
jgi:hypothetical protein